MILASIVAAAVLGFALAADAFAVSLSQGAAAGARPHRAALVVGAAFGLAQGAAPLFGWVVGAAFIGLLAAVDHWVAFAILAALGVKLSWDGLKPKADHGPPPTRATGWALAALAVATSIDAAAAGLTLPALGLAPTLAAAIIGGVTFLACVGGVYAGRAAGARLGAKAEVVGGAMLLIVGLRVLVEHGALPV
jgi:manganese efflux pump family protein